MSTEGMAQAREVVNGYAPGAAAPLVLWGVALTFITPALVALAWVTGDAGNMFTGEPAAPNGFVMLLAIGAGIAAAVALVGGCWRAAKNSDYVAAAMYLQAAPITQESTAAGTSPH